MSTIYFSDGFERVSEHDLRDRYRDFINDCYEPCRIGELSYAPSQVLERVDPTAFRCGFNDWLDAEDWREVDDEEACDEDESTW